MPPFSRSFSQSFRSQEFTEDESDAPPSSPSRPRTVLNDKENYHLPSPLDIESHVSRKRRRLSSMPHDADRFIAGPAAGDARLLFSKWNPPRATSSKPQNRLSTSARRQRERPAAPREEDVNAIPAAHQNLQGNARQALVRYSAVLASSYSPAIVADPPRMDNPPPLSPILQRSRVHSYFASDGPAGRLSEREDERLPSVPSANDLSEETRQKLSAPSRTLRSISTTAYKVLDAPDLEDDFYLTLVDWSCTNHLAVALGKAVYTYSVDSGKVEQLHTYTKARDLESKDLSASVRFYDKGTKLAIGDKRGSLTLFDVETKKRLRVIRGHTERMGSMSVMGNLIATGSKDHSILIRDVRTPLDSVRRIPAHSAEVCGLQFSTFDEPVLASGGDDCKLYIWDLRSISSGTGGANDAIQRGRLSSASMASISAPGGGGDGSRWGDKRDKTTPLLKLTDHSAAVKALAWSPHHRGLLASGGGRQDPMIRFWNTTSGVRIDSLQCQAQITNLAWSVTSDEVVSTHGYGQYTGPGLIQIWHYPSRTSNVSFAAHSGRVLYLATSPNGQSIATASSDQTLRFFSVFPEKGKEVNELGKDVLGRIR